MVPEVVRRVVTGQKSDGESSFTHIEEIEPLRREDGTLQWWGVWGFDELPTLPFFDDQPYLARSLWPAPGGVRVQVVNIPPGEVGSIARPSDEWLRLRAAEEVGYDRDDRTGMHTTDTIDIGVVLSGEIDIIQGNGDRVRLRHGDVYIQNGAEHAWHNDTEEPFIMAFVFLGVHRAEGTTKRLTS